MTQADTLLEKAHADFLIVNLGILPLTSSVPTSNARSRLIKRRTWLANKKLMKPEEGAGTKKPKRVDKARAFIAPTEYNLKIY